MNAASVGFPEELEPLVRVAVSSGPPPLTPSAPPYRCGPCVLLAQELETVRELRLCANCAEVHC